MNRELEDALQDSNREIENYEFVLEEAKRTISQLQEDLKLSKMMVTELTDNTLYLKDKARPTEK